jgi:alcohol dehydrogenase class IV
VFGKSARAVQRAEPLFIALTANGVDYNTFSIAGEPTVKTIMQGTQERCDLVIGFGGGSVIDTGKAISALMANGGDVLDYLEVIGRGKPLAKQAAPFIAIPTTAGTGSEVTRNAVLGSKGSSQGSPELHVKVSLRSALMLPRVALVDPTLTHDLPPALTASTGLDALTQLIEAFVCVRANPMTDAICREGMQRAARSLSRAYEDGQDSEAREDMSLAALLSGMALANAGLGVVHGLAAPIGGMFGVPHGAVCAALLPYAMAVNVRVVRARGSASVQRFDEVARMLTGIERAKADDGVVWLLELHEALRIPRLSSYGVTDGDFAEITEKALASNSMKGNPITLGFSELREILAAAL